MSNQPLTREQQLERLQIIESGVVGMDARIRTLEDELTQAREDARVLQDLHATARALIIDMASDDGKPETAIAYKTKYEQVLASGALERNKP